MSDSDLTLPNRASVSLSGMVIADLRNQLALAKRAADYWKKRADKLDERCADTREALRALFENAPEDEDFFYENIYKGNSLILHWCKACDESANDYERVTHTEDCIIGAAEAVVDKAGGS